MPTRLTENALEEATYIITFAPTDENGDAVTPNAASCTWTLTDLAGNVVNSRSAVAITSATSMNVVLSGNDLAVGDSYYNDWRKVTLQGTYNSTLGNNLPIKEEATFRITRLVAVT